MGVLISRTTQNVLSHEYTFDIQIHSELSQPEGSLKDLASGFIA